MPIVGGDLLKLRIAKWS